MCAQLCPIYCNPWTVACQAHLSMEFSRQEYWSGLSFPSPGDLPNSGIDTHFLCLLHWWADSSPLHHLQYSYQTKEGWDGVGDGREVQKGEDIYIPIADSCWGLTKFCKAIILQLKNKLKKQKTDFKVKTIQRHYIHSSRDESKKT